MLACNDKLFDNIYEVDMDDEYDDCKAWIIEWDMIVVTVFLSILNQMEFNLVQNRKENCNHDHIPFNLKGNGNIVFSV